MIQQWGLSESAQDVFQLSRSVFDQNCSSFEFVIVSISESEEEEEEREGYFGNFHLD